MNFKEGSYQKVDPTHLKKYIPRADILTTTTMFFGWGAIICNIMEAEMNQLPNTINTVGTQHTISIISMIIVVTN